jgi:hypothetical protein
MRREGQHHFLIALLLGVCQASYALTGSDGFLVIPTAPLMRDQAYQIESTLGYHMSEHDGTLADRHPYVSGFRIGLFDRFELGAQYGDKISLDTRMRITAEDGLLPAFTLGMRQIAASQEAHFYSVADAQQQSYAGEFFLAASLGNAWVRGHGGFSILSGLDSNKACPFWGVEQHLGGGLSLLYEGFFRDARTHHNAALQWSFADMVTLTAGATEFHRYFVQDGELGFHTQAEQPTPNGYTSPGIYAAITLTGFMKRDSVPDTRAELAEAKKRLEAQESELRKLQTRMDEFEVTYSETQGQQSDSLSRRAARTEQYFDAIVQGYQADIWDIEDLRAKQNAFLALKGPAFRHLLRTAQHPGAQPRYRETAIRIMGVSKEPLFVEPLQEILASSSESENLRREAALALGSIATPEAKKALAESQKAAPENLRATLEQILKTFAP